MLRYGFELEGFAVNKGTDTVVIPPESWPVDGFPGLVEIRTEGGGGLEDQYFKLLSLISKLDQSKIGILFKNDHVFSGSDMSFLRKHRTFGKDSIDVLNLYGKEQRRIGNKTLASFQINISNETSKRTTRIGYVGDDKNKPFINEIPPEYGLFDVAGIVRRLDLEFYSVIKKSNRQPGMYCIKENCRLEYRSLPSSVFNNNPMEMIQRIKKAVQPPDRN